MNNIIENTREMYPSLKLKIEGKNKTLSEWIKIASQAIDDENFGEAYYLWLTVAAECVDKNEDSKKDKYLKCAKGCLDIWRDLVK